MTQTHCGQRGVGGSCGASPLPSIPADGTELLIARGQDGTSVFLAAPSALC